MIFVSIADSRRCKKRALRQLRLKRRSLLLTNLLTREFSILPTEYSSVAATGWRMTSTSKQEDGRESPFPSAAPFYPNGRSEVGLADTNWLRKKTGYRKSYGAPAVRHCLRLLLMTFRLRSKHTIAHRFSRRGLFYDPVVPGRCRLPPAALGYRPARAVELPAAIMPQSPWQSIRRRASCEFGDESSRPTRSACDNFESAPVTQASSNGESNHDGPI